MAKYGRTTIRSFIGSNLLLCVLSVQVAFALAIVAGLHSLHRSTPSRLRVQPALRRCGRARSSLRCAVQLGESVRITRSATGTAPCPVSWKPSRTRAVEWLWAVDAHENFSFSSRASTALLGYEPAELIGRPVSMIIDEDELAVARQAVADALGGAARTGQASRSCTATAPAHPFGWRCPAGPAPLATQQALATRDPAGPCPPNQRSTSKRASGSVYTAPSRTE